MESIKNTSNNHAFDIQPYDDALLTDKKFKKLELNSFQRFNINQLYSQLPSLLASDALSNAYILKFPEGISGALMQYKSGGFGTAVMGENRIVGHASLYKIETEALMLNAFSAMSIASGQYFLAEINQKFDKINQKIDKIMEFLYEDKKAGLLAEINFVKYAYKNFSSIMTHNEQRIATLSGLQASRKVAMKNIEFDLHDMDNTADEPAKSYTDFKEISNKIFQIRNSLELAMQLYVMSGFMESYFSENYDADYLKSQQEDILFYISRCEKQILSAFSKLDARNKEYKPNLIKKIDPAPLALEIQNITAPLNCGEESALCQTIRTMSNESCKCKKYCITNNGNVYLAA